MSTKYCCKKCLYETTHFNDLLRHINKKKKCIKMNDVCNYSDDQIIVLTLLPYVNKEHIVNEKEIEYLKNSTKLNENLEELIENLNEIDRNKTKKCKYCNEEHTKIIDLKKHIILKCFYKEIDKTKTKTIDSTISNNIKIEGNSNVLNNYCNSQVGNITNIFFDLNSPKPFDEDWDISKIDIKTKGGIIFNNLMYTSLLEEILKNEINLNVILDKQTESGLVYKNDIEKYIQMRSKDIVTNTMTKLKKQLLEINNESKDIFLNDCIDYSRRIINKKYIDYTNSNELQEAVHGCVSDIYFLKKQKAINLSKNVKQNIKIPGF